MKTKLLPLLILPVLLSACTANGNISDVDKTLEGNKPRGDVSLVNDIASKPNNQSAAPNGDENIKINEEDITMPKDENTQQPSQRTIEPQRQQQAQPQATTLPTVTELKIEDVMVGSGKEAIDGKTVTVHYTGRLLNGTKFDSSYDRKEPFKFHLGAGEVIKGWDMGVKGMKIGGKRKLTIPANLAYGQMEVGTIPANSPLVFDVELLGVE